MVEAPDTSANSAWSRLDRLRAPSGANAIAFAALFVGSAAFLFVSYCLARALFGGFGSGIGAITACVAATAAASIFLWWLVPFADFAEYEIVQQLTNEQVLQIERELGMDRGKPATKPEAQGDGAGKPAAPAGEQPAADAAAEFAPACEKHCSDGGGESAFCRDACACVAGEATRSYLFKNARDAQEKTRRLNAIAKLCVGRAR